MSPFLLITSSKTKKKEEEKLNRDQMVAVNCHISIA